MLAALIAWKRAQYQCTNVVDFLAPAWARDLLRCVADYRSEDFSGMLSALYAGEELLAVHLGIRSGSVLHGWFTAYNREFKKYSPGIVFWLNVAEHAHSLGIQRIDFGKGPDRYKESLKTGDIQVAEGAVDLRMASRALRRRYWMTRRAICGSSMAMSLGHFARSFGLGNALRSREPEPAV